MRRQSGFTLLELMIVVAIVAILMAIAIPSYLRYGYRARRPDGQELLLRIANAQERFYATENRYGSLGEVGFDNPAISEKKYYSVTLPAVSSSAFTATAAPQGDQAKDDCGSLSINSVGEKTASGSTNNGTCW